MNTAGKIFSHGDLTMRVSRAKGPGLAWKLSNFPRLAYGWFFVQLARAFSRLTGIPTITGALSIRLRKANGEWIDYGVVSYRLVTDAFVAWLVDCWQGTYEPEIMRYHGCGTGTTAEAANQTALVTESTTILNPDSTRATGTLAEGASANIFSTVGTVTFDGAGAITEHAVFSQAATGGGTMCDRSVFAAVNVASGDSIQFTYQQTLTSGG